MKLSTDEIARLELFDQGRDMERARCLWIIKRALDDLIEARRIIIEQIRSGK